MGLLQWIKRELDSSRTNSSNRRSSEPPLPINRSPLSPSDVSYIAKLFKFNEWESRKLFVKSKRKSFRKLKKEASKISENNIKSINEETVIEENQLIENDTSIIHIGNNSYEEIHPEKPFKVLATRHSFPVNRLQKSKKIQDTSIPDIQTTIVEDELLEFGLLDERGNSPPVTFYKQNSNPYEHILSPARSKPTRLFHSDSFDREALISLAPLDLLEHDFSRALPSIPLDIYTNPNKNQRISLQYQTVINSHGDEVEYALPFNEQSDECSYDTSSTQLKDPIGNQIVLESTKNIHKYVDENFEFLNEKDHNNLSKVETSFIAYSREHPVVTDLDKTDDNIEAIYEQSIKSDRENEILNELESLKMWSQSIANCKTGGHVANPTRYSPIEQNLNNTELLVCTINSIKIVHDTKILQQNYINGKFYSGTFHNVPVTQFVPNTNDRNLTEKILRCNFEILRKIRHPDIAFLMGVSADSNGKLNSLILEPLKCSLNHLLHKEHFKIPLSDCMSYIQQINRATAFMHGNGWVHSNISSHSIMICNNENIVKLASFELATKSDEKVREDISKRFSSFEELETKDIPYDLLPHFLEYRQQFSEHFYQPPELLVTELKFVFPTKQADIYGIALTLWEMLNCCVPFADSSSDNLKKLFYLKHARLPIFEEERCKKFERVLQMGLEVNPDERISDVLSMSELLDRIVLDEEKLNNVVTTTTANVQENVQFEGFPRLLSPKSCGDIIYDRCSTIKKRKNVPGGNRISAKELFISNSSIRNSVDENGDYQFQIDEISLPDTPIARSNKLRKNAWLSNKSISPIVHLDLNSSTKRANEISPRNKKYQVNITIFQKDPQETKVMAINDQNVSNQIKYWNEISLASVRNESLSNAPSTDNNSVSKDINCASPLDKIASPTSAAVLRPTNKSTTISFNEILHKKPSGNNFENSLWKRERQRCEQSGNFIERNGVLTPRPISVKDAVNKFESFSKSFINDTGKNLSQAINSSKTNSFLSKSTLPPKILINNETPQPIIEEANVSKLNVTLRNNLEENNNAQKTISGNKNFQSQLNSGLNNEKNAEKQPMLLTLNFKKLDRRASDIGSYFVQPNSIRRDQAARHSIYGSEIFKRLSKAKVSEKETSVQNQQNVAATVHHQQDSSERATKKSNDFENSKKDFKIKVGKLTCLNCGHKLFVVDDVERNDGNDPIKGSKSELFLTPLKRYPGAAPRSTEDLYIDDDFFCENIELGANMELGTRSEFYDFIDFDIFSADIFNPTEENVS